jgi:hypothetical protein
MSRTSASLVCVALLLASHPARGGEAEALVARADELIRNKAYDSAATTHYKVKTDDPRLLPGKAAELLEQFRAFFDQYWTGKLELHPYDDVGRIYLFYSRFHYSKLFEGTSRAASSWTVGHYREFEDIVALHTDSVGLAGLPDALLHEAAHQLVQKKLYGPETQPSPWLAEGLASYFGNMVRDGEGRFQPAKIGGKSAWIFREGDRSGDDMARHQARAYASLLRKKAARPVDEMVRMPDMASFYSEGREERYAASWLLVHFLMHGDQGAHAAGFVRYLAREIHEDTTAEIFYKDIGMTPDELQAAFEKHARKQG